MDFKDTKAYSLIKEFILKVNNSVKSEKQIPMGKDNILVKIKEIILSTPLSENKGRFANPGMVDVIERIEKITENPYLRNSFGNKIRMDFGTGHELNFLCYLYCCFRKGNECNENIKENESLNSCQDLDEGDIKGNDCNGNSKENKTSNSCQSSNKENSNVDECNGVINDENYKKENGIVDSPQSLNKQNSMECTSSNNTENSMENFQFKKLNKDSNTPVYFPDISISKISQVSGILSEYFTIVRLYIKKFNIEAAGSRGCWSIDDYLLLPYLFGSAENFNNPTPIDCIGEGMFREAFNSNCSSMLKDLCKLSWPSINVGMFKLYVEEVLGRHVVTQHFIYSKYLPIKN